MTALRYALEALGLTLLLGLFALMPARTASNLGGFLGRILGPRLAASRKALRNIEKAFPALSESEQQKIVTGMWDHLGRVIAEYPHLKRLAGQSTSITGQDHLKQVVSQGQGAIFIGGHLGNWEINSIATLLQMNVPVDITYRAPNNPWSDYLLSRARTLGGLIKAYPKERSTGRRMMETLRDHGYLGILVDQKYNEGVAVPFFGRPAMTNPVSVQLAQKYNSPLVPIRNIRRQDGTFELQIFEPLTLFSPTGEPLPVETVIAQIHMLLEGWIREHPEQWLWLHRRWDSKELNAHEHASL